jgi:uncharacterized protein YndB with AHSA1/START domain
MAAKSNKGFTVSTPSDREIQMERVLDAPRELVFKALTDPELIPKWWGRRKDTTTVDKMEVRPGGAWRFTTTADDGDNHAFRGEIREIIPPERVVQTFEWEGLPGHISVDTLTLEEQDGKTKVTIVSTFDSTEDRDGMLQSGMEGGANESWDRLEELLATMT